MSSKKYFILLPVVLLMLAACSLKIDTPKAKQLVENLLNDLKNEKFNAIDQYYISSFNESEPLERKIEKYNSLKEVLGAIESWELVSTNQKYNDDTNINEIELVYKVKCKKLTAKEAFLVINDEGNLKIIFQNVENMK